MTVLDCTTAGTAVLEALAAVALYRRSQTLLAAFLCYMSATDVVLLVAGILHTPGDPLYRELWQAQMAGQCVFLLALTWATIKQDLTVRLPLSALGTAAFAVVTAHPRAWNLETWFAALSLTGCFCCLMLASGGLRSHKQLLQNQRSASKGTRLEGLRENKILAAYCALYAVLYSNARESIGNIGLAQNIGVIACMVAWLISESTTKQRQRLRRPLKLWNRWP